MCLLYTYVIRLWDRTPVVETLTDGCIVCTRVAKYKQITSDTYMHIRIWHLTNYVKVAKINSYATRCLIAKCYICQHSCCISNFKVYLRTLDIEHRIYRRKRNLLNLPYLPMITICSLSTVMICVKRSQIWSNGYCPCDMFHGFFFVVLFFLFVSSFQLYFNFVNYQPWQRILSVTTCCVVMTSVFLWYFPMEWNADWLLRVCAFSSPISILPHSI